MIGSDDGSTTYESRFSNDDKVCVKMRGIPFRATDEDLYDFFSGYDYIEESLIIGVKPDGLRTGQAVILMLSEEEAKKVVEDKNGHTIGERWVELFIEDFKFYTNFYDSGIKLKDISISEMLKNDDLKARAVRLRGIPFTCEKKDVVNFMKEFGVKEDAIQFEFRNNKFSGRAVVFLDSYEEAIKVHEQLHKKYIKNRYIEIDVC